MKIQRTVPPAAAPIQFSDLFRGATGLLFGKKYLNELEKELTRYFGVKHVFPVSSGKAALTLILQALKALSPERRKVLIPAYTCFSVPSAIVKAGLTVSACDISPDTFDFDYELLKKELDDEILCVVSTHLFGIPADTDRLSNICKHRGIFVVEDAAQAMGVEGKGRKLGTLGDAGFFSLGRGKNITCGSGGIIVTNDRRIAEAVREQYRNVKHPSSWDDIKELVQLLAMKCLMHPGLYWLPAGIPSLRLGETIFHKEFPIKNLSGMKAGLLRQWESRLMKANHDRQKTCEALAKKLEKSAAQSAACPCIRFPVLAQNKNLRDEIYLRGKTSGVSLMYPTPVNEITEIRELFQGRVFPNAKTVAERLITLPTHALLTVKDKMEIMSAANVVRNPQTINYQL